MQIGNWKIKNIYMVKRKSINQKYELKAWKKPKYTGQSPFPKIPPKNNVPLSYKKPIHPETHHPTLENLILHQNKKAKSIGNDLSLYMKTALETLLFYQNMEYTVE